MFLEMFTCKFWSGRKFSFLLGRYLGVELVGLVVPVGHREEDWDLSRVAAPSFIPTNSMQLALPKGGGTVCQEAGTWVCFKGPGGLSQVAEAVICSLNNMDKDIEMQRRSMEENVASVVWVKSWCIEQSGGWDVERTCHHWKEPRKECVCVILGSDALWPDRWGLLSLGCHWTVPAAIGRDLSGERGEWPLSSDCLRF